MQIQRTPFRRTLTILLSADGPIRVRTGLMTSQKSILDFLNLKKKWIQKNLERYREVQLKRPKPLLKHGDLFPFMGKNLRLHCVLTPNAKTFFSLHEDLILLHIPAAQWSKDSRQLIFPWMDQLIRFYEKEARQRIAERVAFWSQKTQLIPSKLKFRAPKTRWGSCSSQKVLNLNWKLIVFSPETIDYVVIHELAHLKYLNHSEQFWNLVESHCPHYKQCEKELKADHFKTSFLSQLK